MGSVMYGGYPIQFIPNIYTTHIQEKGVYANLYVLYVSVCGPELPYP